MRYLFSVVAISFAVMVISCSDSPELKTGTAAVPVDMAPVMLEQVTVPIHTSGILAPVSQIKLSFKTGGIIRNIPVNEGDRVQKGQLLANLNMSEIKARVRQAESAFEKAQRDLQRVEILFRDSVATKEQFQNAQTGVDMAQSELEVARFNMEYSSIEAPADGSILRRFSEPNELVSPGQPVFIFGVTGNAWLVRVGVTEQDLMKLSLGDSARVTFDAYPGEIFSAKVSEIAEAAHPLNGTFEVELILHKPAQQLKSGFIAKTELFPSRTETHYTIPIEALVEADEGSAYVFVPSDNQDSVRKIPIRIAFVFDNRVAVQDGLSEIDQVISTGSAYLNDKSRIEVTKIKQ